MQEDAKYRVLLIFTCTFPLQTLNFSMSYSLIASTTPSSTIKDNFFKTLINMHTEGAK